MVQLVLLERIAKLGQMGDVVNVKPGYARNFLLPQGKALPANSKNLKKFEAEKANLEAANLESRARSPPVTDRTQSACVGSLKDCLQCIRLHPKPGLVLRRLGKRVRKFSLCPPLELV